MGDAAADRRRCHRRMKLRDVHQDCKDNRKRASMVANGEWRGSDRGSPSRGDPFIALEARQACQKVDIVSFFCDFFWSDIVWKCFMSKRCDWTQVPATLWVTVDEIGAAEFLVFYRATA